MANQSLLQGDDQQLKLFGSADMDAALFATEESAPQRVFTGARLFAQNPELYKAIVALSAEGLGAIRIGRILHVSAHTVQAVREREPAAVAIEKNRIANLSRAGARMCVEGIMDMLSDPDQAKKISLKDKGIVFGILAEKSELLSGAPTSRILNVTTTIDYDDYVRGRREEYERQRMGLSGGNGKTNAEAAAGAQKDVGPGAIVDPGARGVVNPSGSERISVDPSGSERISVGLAPTAGQAAADPEPAPGAVRRRPVALLEAPKDHLDLGAIVDPGANCSVGQTPHRQDDMPVNIDRKQGEQKETGLMGRIYSEIGTTSA